MYFNHFMLKHYNNLKSFFEYQFPKLDAYTRAHRRVIKYVISGGTSAWTDIALLFVFTHFFGLYYIYSSIIAWIIAFWISFFLQKFWTFGKRTLKGAHRELVLYFSVALINLVINTCALYVFVEYLHVNYLISQIIIGLATAVVTYSINKFFIFKHIHPVGKHVIVIATPSYPPDPGGPPTHAEKYVKEFGKAGHEVRLVVFSRLLGLPTIVRHFVFAFLVLRQSIGADVIYVLDPISSGPAAYVARFLRKPYVIRVGGDVVWERAVERGKTKLSCLEFYKAGDYTHAKFYGVTKSVLRYAKRVIIDKRFPSDNPLATIYSNYYDIPAIKITGIPNPLPASISVSAPVERSLVFSSRLVKYKNLAMVVDALLRVNIIFYVLGDGPERTHLESKVESLRSKVRIMGTVARSEKDEYLKKCMLTIAPALTEFNPNYVLEGFAMGKPTLMSRENGLPFALPESMLFDPRNPLEFTEKLTYLLSDTGYTEAQNWVKQLSYHQTWDDVVKKNLEIIKEVCAS